jgi:hypothetical protein
MGVQADRSAPVPCSGDSRIVFTHKADLLCVISTGMVRAEDGASLHTVAMTARKVSGAISRLSLKSGWAPPKSVLNIASQMMYKERDGRDDRETWPAKPNAIPL